MSAQPVTRRRMLLAGSGAVAGGLLLEGATGAADAAVPHARTQHGKLPVKTMEHILQAQGTVTDGVLSIDIARSDIGNSRGPRGVTFTPSFEIDGTLTFQPLGDHLAMFNGDLPLKPDETDAFIDAIIANGLTFQAFHQHFTEMNPQVWFIHWRGVGAPAALAKAVHATLKATSTPLPQRMPKHPKSPLDAKRLGKILHGDAQVGDDGVVTVNVLRTDHILIGGIRANPNLNIMTGVEFKPRSSHGARADVAPDFSMTSDEVQRVVRFMRAHDWQIGCLYNQETAERPQLYFSHMLKSGNAYELAAEIRLALNRTASS